ncbi:MAG: hypothetical protein WD875_15900 [Pirellulales bacterium]
MDINSPDNAGDDVPVVARHPLLLKLMATIIGVVGITLIVAETTRRPAVTFLVIISLAIAALSVVLWIYACESLTATSSGIVWRRLLRGRRRLEWPEVDTITDRETAVVLRCSWRGTEIPISRRLPQVNEILDAARKHVAVETMLVPQTSLSLPATFYVGLNVLGVWLGYVAFVLVVGALAIWSRELVLACVMLAGAVLTATRVPYLWFDIHGDRFVLQKIVSRTTVPFTVVESIQIDTTTFYDLRYIKCGQLTNNKIVLRLAMNNKIEFAPRSGALAVSIVAQNAIESWRRSVTSPPETTVR